jgi:N-acetylglucosamine malate deacetylase 1
LSETRSREALVLAPHPDDETFGCGGTIRMLVESGIAVDVAFMTRGEMGVESGVHPTAEVRRAVAGQRSKEARAACDVLGVRQAMFLDGADTQLQDQPHLAEAIFEILRRAPYQRVFCPGPEDAHKDHIATFSHLRRAAAEHRAPLQFWLYEVWKPLAANTYVPIDNTMETKRLAIEQYASQLALLNYREAFVGLAAYRSLFCPSSRYAEAFLVYDRDEILNLR